MGIYDGPVDEHRLINGSVCESCGCAPCVNPGFCEAARAAETSHKKPESASLKRARAMIFPNFDCDNAGGERMTQMPDSSDAPSCFAQDPPAWPPGNKNRYPHIDRADYSSR